MHFLCAQMFQDSFSPKAVPSQDKLAHVANCYIKERD